MPAEPAPGRECRRGTFEKALIEQFGFSERDLVDLLGVQLTQDRHFVRQRRNEVVRVR